MSNARTLCEVLNRVADWRLTLLEWIEESDSADLDETDRQDLYRLAAEVAHFCIIADALAGLVPGCLTGEDRHG
jgi:hypothetical protein